MRKRDWLLLGAFVAMAGCSDPLDPQWRDVRDAEAAWERRGTADYSYTMMWLCYCQRAGTFEVHVEDGAISSAFWIAQDMEGAEVPAMTVEQMFRRIRDALAEEPDEAEVEFSDDGFPTEVWFDPEAALADEEWGFRLVSLEQR